MADTPAIRYVCVERFKNGATLRLRKSTRDLGENRVWVLGEYFGHGGDTLPHVRD